MGCKFSSRYKPIDLQLDINCIQYTVYNNYTMCIVYIEFRLYKRNMCLKARRIAKRTASAPRHQGQSRPLVLLVKARQQVAHLAQLASMQVARLAKQPVLGGQALPRRFLGFKPHLKGLNSFHGSRSMPRDLIEASPKTNVEVKRHLSIGNNLESLVCPLKTR